MALSGIQFARKRYQAAGPFAGVFHHRHQGVLGYVKGG